MKLVHIIQEIIVVAGHKIPGPILGVFTIEDTAQRVCEEVKKSGTICGVFSHEIDE